MTTTTLATTMDPVVKVSGRHRMEQDGLRILLRARAMRELQMKELELQIYNARREHEQLARDFDEVANVYIDRSLDGYATRDQATQTMPEPRPRPFPALRLVMGLIAVASVAAARIAFLVSDPHAANFPRLRRLLLRHFGPAFWHPAPSGGGGLSRIEDGF
mmetsp:Transcript_28080/g.90526  ORF Transcript_28080/g.90526 Transcript_28080/m.90526 type:complete len:161 (+) Transcript_28080:1667-2149(+)|eukprot:CAMPEP_0118909788 /NCGR_PEP_ID=MMETSP1166-20130328/12218_1 /TAXON_ID=1104430 /ORGANISM="Chrysoreinhardia sp, Strain CCMP3193" /LENGTH=160 /DNA_ID=CAMNT_0006849237 /DNA_START=17 /DNA_END=499 /DNA_ORIENTATION=-